MYKCCREVCWRLVTQRAFCLRDEPDVWILGITGIRVQKNPLLIHEVPLHDKIIPKLTTILGLNIAVFWLIQVLYIKHTTAYGIWPVTFSLLALNPLVLKCLWKP